MKKVVVTLLCGAVVLGLTLGTARAIPPFKAEFDKMYVKKDSTDAAEKALAEAVEKVKCNTCHVGKEKKNHNAYGKALAEILDKKTDAKDAKKIQEALKTVSEQKSNPDDDNSPTFGDLLKEGKLPGGEE